MTGVHRKKPPRLKQIFQRYDPPLYFVTFCTMHRRSLLAKDHVHKAFRSYAERGAREKSVAVGRYVILPDHVHVFVRGDPGFRLSDWCHGLKRAMSQPIREAEQKAQIWQPGFFDHILRNSESYSKAWHYVMNNPVRAGLVERAEDWPYQGEVVRIDHV